jgi:hypothetical protein
MRPGMPQCSSSLTGGTEGTPEGVTCRSPTPAEHASVGIRPRSAGTGRISRRRYRSRSPPSDRCRRRVSRLPQPSPAHPRPGCCDDWRALDAPPWATRFGCWRTRRSSNQRRVADPSWGSGMPVAACPIVMRGSALTVRRKASDLLVAVALVHGADHLAGGYVQHDARVGGVVAAVVSGLPTRHPGQRRQHLRRVRIGAAGRQVPPRVYRATFSGRPGTTVIYPARSIRAAVRSSAIAAAFTRPWFAEPRTHEVYRRIR